MERRSNRSRRASAALLGAWAVVNLSSGAFAAQAEAAQEIAGHVRACECSKEPAGRQTALETLARIGKGCTQDAERKAAAAGLAKGLADDDPAVRAVAIGFLMDGPDRDVALDALLASARDFARELASLEDDRSVDGLGVLAKVIGASDELHRALARYGTTKCPRYAADGLAKTGATRAELAERCAKVREYRIGRKPSWFEGDALAWLGQEERRIAELLAPLKKELALFDARAAKILEIWQSFAQERVLPPPPESAWEARGWSAWAEAGAPLLPATIGAR